MGPAAERRTARCVGSTPSAFGFSRELSEGGISDGPPFVRRARSDAAPHPAFCRSGPPLESMEGLNLGAGIPIAQSLDDISRRERMSEPAYWLTPANTT